VKPILPYNEADGNGAGLFNPVPRFRRRNGTAKIQTVKGLRVEIFRAFCGKYYPALGGLDRRNGLVWRKKAAYDFS